MRNTHIFELIRPIKTNTNECYVMPVKTTFKLQKKNEEPFLFLPPLDSIYFFSKSLE